MKARLAPECTVGERGRPLWPVLSLALTLALLLGAGVPQAAAEERTGVPVVHDGDTVELGGEVIRLQGIDAPELGQLCQIGDRSYDCGMVARTALLDLTAGVTVRCRIAAGSSNEGGEGRPGHCFAADYDLSEGMVYTGWALARHAPSERYPSLERGAREAGRGLWKGRFVTPWDWRAGERLTPEAAGN